MENTIEKLYGHYLKTPKISTDTRNITPGSIFFALKGDNFNGNSFAENALKNGASLAVIDEEVFDKGKGYFLVKDALMALQELANFHRRKLDIPFIAITGSNGKTTTKELVCAVLSAGYSTLATYGNLNNHIGVPFTLLSVNHLHKVAVIEMGANHQKEIELLCKIAEPDFGLITNIGKAHLEGFGGIEGVKKGKGEMYDYLKSKDGFIFINPDQEPLVDLLGQYERFLSYGINQNYDLSGYAENESAFLKVIWKKKGDTKSNSINTNLTGNYNLTNVLAAVSIGDYFDIEPEKICMAIANYQPGNQRSQVIKKGTNTIVLDAYNANPTSMEAALKNFSENYKGSKLVVLGDMLELGSESLKEHQNIANIVEKLGFEEVVLVGDNFKVSSEKIKCHYFENSDQAKEWISGRKFSNQSVLIKGSRGLKMEKTLEGF